MLVYLFEYKKPIVLWWRSKVIWDQHRSNNIVYTISQEGKLVYSNISYVGKPYWVQEVYSVWWRSEEVNRDKIEPCEHHGTYLRKSSLKRSLFWCVEVPYGVQISLLFSGRSKVIWARQGSWYFKTGSLQAFDLVCKEALGFISVLCSCLCSDEIVQLSTQVGICHCTSQLVIW